MKLTHKAYLHLENIYHSPYVLEYWGMKRGLPFIAELYRQGKQGEDPVITYKRMSGLDQKQFCDEMFDAYRHFINWDFPRVWKETRPYANKYTTSLTTLSDGWYGIAPDNCPENYGFNAIPLALPEQGKKVKVEFCGEAGKEGYNAIHTDKADWRYGFVAITEDGKSIYGDVSDNSGKSIIFTAPKVNNLTHLWLVVMGAPTEHWMNPNPEEKMPNGHIASKLQEVNLYKQNAMLARATYVNSRNNTRAIIYACIAVLSWSTVATAFKIALTHLTHFEMLLIASCTSLLIFALLLTFQKKWKLLSALPARQWGYFALLGLLNPVAYYLVLFKAYDLLPAQVAQPINYAWPIVLLILLALFARQPIPPKKYIGMFISLGGVVLISVGTGQSGGMDIPVHGLLLAALSALLWAMYWMINNKFKDRTDGSVALFMSFLFGTAYLLVGAMIVGVHLNTLPGILSGMYVGGFEIGIPFIFSVLPCGKLRIRHWSISFATCLLSCLCSLLQSYWVNKLCLQRISASY